jgi:ATP-dependent DNA helicase RecG
LCEIPRSSGDLMGELGMSHRTFFRSTVLEPLLAGSLIQQTHPDLPNHPNQAYVLTEAGLRLLELMKTSGQTQNGD